METYLHLLIDGYNVIHSWPELRLYLKKKGDGATLAREHLVTAVRAIHDVEALKTTVVFDGQGARSTIEHPTEESSFSIIYAAASVSADGVIEQLVAKSMHPQGFVAVTKDTMISESLETLGAVTITPDLLKDWIDRCTARESQEIRERRRSIAMKWGQRLDLNIEIKKKG